MTQKAIPELGIDTQTLERALLALQIGEVISYADLSASIGRDVQREAHGNLATARKRLLRSHRMVFGAVINIGIKRLSDEGKIAAAHGHLKRGRTQFKMVRASVASVDDFSALPNRLKIEHNVMAAQAGAILSMTSSKNTRKLEAAVGDGQKTFKPSDSLELMKRSL